MAIWDFFFFNCHDFWLCSLPLPHHTLPPTPALIYQSAQEISTSNIFRGIFQGIVTNTWLVFKEKGLHTPVLQTRNAVIGGLGPGYFLRPLSHPNLQLPVLATVPFPGLLPDQIADWSLGDNILEPSSQGGFLLGGLVSGIQLS